MAVGFGGLGVENPVMSGVGFTGSYAEAVQVYDTPGTVTEEESGTGWEEVPEQISWGFVGVAGKSRSGFGFTVMVKLVGEPGQAVPPLEKEGVTMMEPVMGASVALVAVNVGIVPDPEAPSPMVVLLLTQS